MYLWDTKGAEDYERLTKLAYFGADCFLLCFDLTDRNSFDRILSKWNDGTWKVKSMQLPRPTPYHPLHYVEDGTPLILVGLKSDGNRVVNSDEAAVTAKTIGANKYVECSSLTQSGLRSVFDEALRAMKIHKPKEWKKCASAKKPAPVQYEKPQGTLKMTIIEAQDLLAMDIGGKSDPFVVFDMGGGKEFKTEIIKKNLNPKWDAKFEIVVSHSVLQRAWTFHVYDWDRIGKNDKIGVNKIDIPLVWTLRGRENEFDTWLDLYNDEEGRKAGKLHVSFRYVENS
jgi:Ras-related C3 botulinum toxin substrate 1